MSTADKEARICRYRAAYEAANGYPPREVTFSRGRYRVGKADGPATAFTTREFESATIALETRAGVFGR